MRNLASLMVLSCLVLADPILVPEIGLAVELPDGWRRETDREKESLRLAAIHGRGKTVVRFQVETSDAQGYDPAAWAETKKQAMGKIFKEIQEAFTVEKGKAVGGKDAIAFTCGGRAVLGGDECDLRYHVAALVHRETFFEITEISYNKAHEDEETADAIARLWQGIRFGDANAPAADLDVPEGAAEQELKDEASNYNLKLPPGWEIERSPDPNADSKTPDRAVVKRNDAKGNTAVVLFIYRYEALQAALFVRSTAGEVLGILDKEHKFMERFFGQGSAGFIHPRVNEGVSLGGADKAGAFEYRSITMEEQHEITEAENKKRRGEKGVEIPEFQQTVVRGRIALLSPFIYVPTALFRKDVADDPELLKEFNQVLDSWEFLVGEPIPPPLRFGDEEFGDTTADPANQTERKDSVVYTETGRKAYRVQDEFVLPPGFQRIKGEGGNLAVGIVAQDAKHNSVQILIIHVSWKKTGEEKKVPEEKDRVFASWKSNWESKAKNTRIPRDTKKFRLGNLNGEGYQNLEGTLDDFGATFTGLLEDKSGWRTIIEVETRANGATVFEEGIKKFLKSWKVKPLK